MFIFALFAATAHPDEKVTVAVLDLTGKGVPNIAATAASDIIRSEFVNIVNFS